MKKQLSFKVPFTGFAALNFISCFTSAYVYLENIPLHDGDSKCAQFHGNPCHGCGNCETSNPMRDLDTWFFLFDTMCGRSSLRMQFDGRRSEMQKRIGETEEDDYGTDDTVDFLFGFTGYSYRKLTESSRFADEILWSINDGKPVIAKVKSGEGRFRIVTGIEGDRLLYPDYANAQNRPETMFSLDELELLYIIGEKTESHYTLLDGLKRISEVMEYNLTQGLMEGYVLRLGWYSNGIDGMGQTDAEDRKRRMQRVSDTMWYTFNSHNFAQVFGEFGKAQTVYDKISGMAKFL